MTIIVIYIHTYIYLSHCSLLFPEVQCSVWDQFHSDWAHCFSAGLLTTDSHSYLFENFTFLRYRGGNGLFWIFWPFLVFSTVRYIRIAGKQTDWEHRGVKEHRKRKNKSHLGKFFDSFSNLNHVRKSKHQREENGYCYLVRHKTSLKQFKIKV